MQKTERISTLNFRQLADLYTQLARMEDAGIPQPRAINGLIQAGNPLSARLYQFINHLQAGRRIAESGFRAGLFNELDRELISAGEFSGRIGEIYQQLANYYEDKARHIKKIKSQLFFPLSVLLLALLIQPIPALIVGKITGMDYILISLGSFVYLLLLLFIVWRLTYWLTQGKLRFLGLRQPVFQMQLSLPLIAPWIIRRQIKEFLLVLGLMLDAGVPVVEALPKSAKTVKNALLAERISASGTAIQQGCTLTDALMQVQEFKPSTLQIIAVGEQSGKLASCLLHFAEVEAEVINLQEQMLAEWLPRLIYTVITVWVAYSIIGAYTAYFSTLSETISSIS